MKRVTFFVLLIAINIASTGQNLVVNPGFETWNKTTRPAGWDHVENCLKDSASVISGSYSCMHSGGTTTTSDLGQTIPVTPGNEYRLSLFNKTITTSTGKGSRIWCYWKDSENNSLYDAATDEIMRPSQYFRSDSWQEFSINVIAPPEAAAFYLEVRTNTKSIAWWDDIRFEETITTFYEKSYEAQINIYPNPAGDFLFVSNTQGLQHIDILSYTGKLIWFSDAIGKQNLTIPVSEIPQGLYIIRITTADKVIVRKFLKE